MAGLYTPKVAIFVIMRNGAGDLLLQQRANTSYLDGYYDFACSGHVEAGESIQQAAIRELAEEIGVSAKAEDLKLVHFNQNNLDTPYINFTFILESWVGEPKICEPEKCSDLAYFPETDLPARCTLNVRVNQQAGFAENLTYSFVTLENFKNIMGEDFSG